MCVPDFGSSFDLMSAEWTIAPPGGKEVMARKGSGARRRNVRSLERGLALLVAMNRASFVGRRTRARNTLAAADLYRLLETLERAGYVTRSRPLDRYCLSHKVAA